MFGHLAGLQVRPSKNENEPIGQSANGLSKLSACLAFLRRRAESELDRYLTSAPPVLSVLAWTAWRAESRGRSLSNVSDILFFYAIAHLYALSSAALVQGSSEETHKRLRACGDPSYLVETAVDAPEVVASMLLATGITALSRKIKDDKERKREAKQGVLTVGPSDVAKRAFEGQTSRMIQAGPVDPLAVNRVGTEIKYEDANDIEPESPEEVLPDPKKPDVRVTHGTPQVKASSPVMSETTSGILSPIDQTIADPSTPTTYTDEMHRPPTYASRPESSSMSARSPSSYSQDESLRRLKTEKNRRSSPSTNSLGTHAVRVKTKGANLSSGFPYHPALFDLKVHPDKWAAFTEQVVHATKVSASDSRKVWAAATATAMSGAIVTSVFLKKYAQATQQVRVFANDI